MADDQIDVVLALRLLLRGPDVEVDSALSIPEIRERLGGRAYDLLLMDLNYARDTTSGREGLDLLQEIHASDPLLPVIVMTGWGGIDTAVEAMRRGARTFVPKPWDNHALTAAVHREIENGRALRRADTLASNENADARAIQRALLPSVLPEPPGCRLAARWEPAMAFGGDCYDVIRLTDSSLALTIGDVCGKGLPAALLMSNVMASIRAFAARDRSPRALVSSVNAALCRHTDLRRFVTLFYGVYDLDTRRLVYTNAGHNPPLVISREGSPVRLAAGGMVTGLLDTARYEEGAIVLQPADRLVLFTDGITEAQSAEGLEFGEEGILETVRQRPGAHAPALVDAIFAAVDSFTGGDRADDATVMTMDLVS